MPCSSHPPPNAYPADHRVPPIRRQILDWESSLFFSLQMFSEVGNRPYFTHNRTGARRQLETYRVPTTAEGVLSIFSTFILGGFNNFIDIVMGCAILGLETIGRWGF
ncbi:hypothetical protein TWF970_011525 [Orbilia oligospora]|uniref:Uncharacterized protein n=1 Tax=Orbilia oligospora TaxID=2813651 RepID=A0A7C8RFI1_ORBOL|nr:hypothetical protein TWF970_011525 [Orbilia oligospora]